MTKVQCRKGFGAVICGPMWCFVALALVLTPVLSTRTLLL